MKISIIGAGRVGQTLGRLALQSGYDIGEVVCRSERSALRAAQFIGAGDPLAAAHAQLSRADIILISTPDDRINDAVEIIRSNASRTGRGVVLHTSGAMSSDALAPLIEHGMSTGSCHPLQTFSSPERALALVSQCYFCIEGERRAVTAARRFARKIGARHFEIATEMKGLYHAAAVMASGGIVALLSMSLEMLSRCGLSEAESRRILLPLVEGAVANAREEGPARAITGPVRRGDAGTVAKNMQSIASIDADWAEVYRLLAERSMTLAESAGADEALLAEVRRILGK